MSGSPIRCRGPWKLHKRAAEPDRWLDEMGFFRKHTARDASCLFRAVSENVYNTQRYFHKVRMECVEFMASKRHMFEGSVNTCPFDTYLKEISNPSEWGGLLEISALSHLYRHDFVIFEANKGPQTKICNGYGNNIYLYYTPETKHFDTVYTKEFINEASFAQSLVYEMLYDGVYHLKDLSYAVDKMLYDKMPTNHIDYFMAENVERRKKQKDRAKIYIESSQDENKEKNTLTLKCKHHTEDPDKASLLKESLSIFVFNRSLIQLENVCINCLNVNSAKDLIDNGITPFPYKVAKALDPDIYRNIEFDVWTDMRREMRYGTRYSDGMTLQVGVKCLCKLHPDQTTPYHCHIQEMTPDGGPCLVFIEELGEKRVVNFKQLEPLPRDEARPWAPPYRYSRSSQLLTLSQMLQQIGNITRKSGPPRSRTKSKSFSDEPQRPELPISPKTSLKMPWNEDLETTELNDFQMSPLMTQTPFNFTTYQHLDLVNFQPMPVEISALPLMVDCRAGELPPAPAETHHAPPQRMTNGVELAGVTSPAARASTPAAVQPTYTPGIPSGVGGMGVNTMGGMGAVSTYPCAPYSCGMKVWLAPPPLPPNVSPHVYKSIQPNGSDLPMNDMATLRYYFNLGVDCMWAAYGPPRHFSPRDLAQDMQQMSLHERPLMTNNGHEQNHKHKPPQLNDKHGNNQGKGNGQRPLLGPRFKRGNQDGGNPSNHGNHNNHNQNKGHNNGNNINNKGPNNRRNSQSSGTGAPLPPPPPPALGVPPGPLPPPHKYWEFPEPLSYVPYPPPYYTLPYYPIDAEQGMVQMVGGVPYLPYVEEGDMSGVYPPAPPALPALPYPPPALLPPAHAHHLPPPAPHDHK